MKRNVLFWRVCAVIILTVVITALFTTAVFRYVSGLTFSAIEEQELLPRARVLSNTVKRHGSDPDMIRMLLNADEYGSTLLGAYAVVIDDRGKIRYSTDGMDLVGETVDPKITERMLSGHEVTESIYIPGLQADMVLAGVPMRDGDRITGSVMLFVTKTEALAARGSLSRSLMYSLFLVMPFILCMTFVLVNVLVRPIRRMTDTAVGLAAGNFELVAYDSEKGEIGQIGRSLNRIAGQLSQTIAALTLERNRLMQILDGLNEGIIAVDAQGRVTHHNKALGRLFTAKETDADEHMRYVPIEEVWQDFRRVVESGETITRNVETGDKIIGVSMTPVRSNTGNIAGAVGLFVDVTEIERLERTRRDYVANVSHELRTPLTAMRGLIEPLCDGLISDEETQKRYYDIILRETMRLSRLINDLMELSRLQSGAMAFTPEKVDMAELFYDIADRYQSVAEEHELTFSLDTDMEPCPRVYANADRVEQLTLILIDNAIKYTPTGGEVHLSAEWNEEKVTVCVRDTGIGIAAENLPYVFDRFYKVDKAHSGRGSGLGLSIAKEMLDQMNETITVESEPGKGSAFRFTLSVYAPH